MPLPARETKCVSRLYIRTKATRGGAADDGSGSVFMAES